MTSKRLRGNADPVFTLKLGAAPAVPMNEDLKTSELTWEDKDDSDLTFSEAAAGLLQDGTLTLTAVASTDEESFWRWCWDHPGQDVVVVWGPHGNAVPTADQPHFTGTASTAGKPELKNEAKSPKDKTGSEFEIEFVFSTDVELVDA